MLHFKTTSLIMITLAAALALGSAAIAQERPAVKTSMPADQFTRPNQPLDAVVPYPKPHQGDKRYAIYLPPLPNEQQAKVELVIGKVMRTDCNGPRINGKLHELNVKGWGYPFYVARVTPGPSTLMACPTPQKRNEFVTANLQNNMLRYNSRLPIVVYAPADMQVRYRVWKPGGLQNAVNK